ncbi:hypothetical protein MC885_021120 [Smutsia gigantea]|nr:hypothetical protein MC885_021120 [Smutsia gigantea]
MSHTEIRPCGNIGTRSGTFGTEHKKNYVYPITSLKRKAWSKRSVGRDQIQSGLRGYLVDARSYTR